MKKFIILITMMTVLLFMGCFDYQSADVKIILRSGEIFECKKCDVFISEHNEWKLDRYVIHNKNGSEYSIKKKLVKSFSVTFGN